MKISSTLRKRRAETGKRGESIAAKHLTALGMTILARNWKSRAGELDIVAFDGTQLIFAEVKTRRFKPGFPPALNLSYRQRKRNFNAARFYLKSFDITGIPARFDLIEVTLYPGVFARPQLHIIPGYLPDLPPLDFPESAPPPPEKTAVSPLARKLFFNSCPVCGQTVDAPHPFCSSCMSKLLFFNPDYRCPGCGGENHGALEFCNRCLAEPPRPWQHSLALFAYRSIGKELIRKLKFRNQPELARPLGKLAADLLLDSGISPDLIVPIPLHPLRYLRRSYNQSALLAGIISAYTAIPTANCLRRKFTFRKQSALNRKARHRGLKNAFIPTNISTFSGKHLLLIDDVLTTGATLSAAATALIDAGAAGISILVIARTTAYTSLKPL